MLQCSISFPEFAEFTEILFYLGKTPMGCIHLSSFPVSVSFLVPFSFTVPYNAYKRINTFQCIFHKCYLQPFKSNVVAKFNPGVKIHK